MKKHILIFILIGAMLGSIATVYAQDTVKKIEAYINESIKLELNGKPFRPVDFDGTELKPIVYNGRTYLPTRAIAEAVGYEVIWEGETRTIKLRKRNSENEIINNLLNNKEVIKYLKYLNYVMNYSNNKDMKVKDLPNVNELKSIKDLINIKLHEDKYMSLKVKGKLVKKDNGDWYIVIKWQPMTTTMALEDLLGYKIVVSKKDKILNNYKDGYILWTSDKNRNIVYIDRNTKIIRSDVTEYLEEGGSYYFNVLAVFKDKTIKGNPVKITIPRTNIDPILKNYQDDVIKHTLKDIYLKEKYIEDVKDSVKEYVKPKVEGKLRDLGDTRDIVLEWNKIESEDLKGYKVVVSRYNENPSYPDDGYIFWITDKNKTRVEIDKNTKIVRSDFGNYIKEGGTYYFSVTAVYKDRKIAGNSVKIFIPEKFFK